MNIHSVEEARHIVDDPERNVFEREQAIHYLVAHPTPRTVDRLVAKLDDDEFGVRWAAAASLARFGRAALEPLLEALMQHPDSFWIREGAYHVFHYTVDHSMREQTVPLQEALKGPAASVATAISAWHLLQELKREHSTQHGQQQW